MECDVWHIFSPELYNKDYIICTVTSHCVSRKHVTERSLAIAKTV